MCHTIVCIPNQIQQGNSNSNPNLLQSIYEDLVTKVTPGISTEQACPNPDLLHPHRAWRSKGTRVVYTRWRLYCMRNPSDS